MTPPAADSGNAIVQKMAAEHREAFAAVASHRRTLRRALVESTIEQLRRFLPPLASMSATARPAHASQLVQLPCLPMPDVLSGSTVNTPPSTHMENNRGAVGREELRAQLQALYQPDEGIATASSPMGREPVQPSQHLHQPQLVAPALPSAATNLSKQQVMDSLRRLYN